MSKTWVEMSNGVILDAIPFVAYVRDGAEEKRFDFTVPNPVNQHGDPDLFHRLSFECIQAKLSGVDHIIRGECSEGGYRPCYVYSKGARVPFAVIIPGVYAK